MVVAIHLFFYNLYAYDCDDGVAADDVPVLILFGKEQIKDKDLQVI
ncbi:MAG: hypothetical protein GY756_20235 [bacterium]|nr:hypothetical protein [bacterium]